MAYEIEVKELEPQLALTVHTRASMTDIGEAMGRAFTAIGRCLEQRGATPVAPPFALYPADVKAEFDVSVCVPVAEGAEGCDDVVLETVPGGTVASTVHRGPYAGLGTAYGTLQAWMVANDKKPEGPCREVYLTEPGSVPDEELLTEIHWPFS